jgi:DNA mismatch endonuclease, patch repair protein
MTLLRKDLRNTLINGKFVNVNPLRSGAMRAIKSKGNKSTEVKLRLALVREGISGWKMHPKKIVGKPDFYFSKENIALFVDGCFWHGCPRCGHLPKTNSAFWEAKIEENRSRDIKATEELSRSGTKVLRFWEHEVADIQTVTAKIKETLERK